MSLQAALMSKLLREPETKEVAHNLASRVATSPFYPTSAVAEALRGSGYYDQESVIEGVPPSRPPLQDIMGTQEWFQQEMGADPEAMENIVGDLISPDPMAKFAVLGPILRSAVKKGYVKVPRDADWVVDNPNWVAEVGDPKLDLSKVAEEYNPRFEVIFDPITDKPHWKSARRKGNLGEDKGPNIWYDKLKTKIETEWFPKGEPPQWFTRRPKLIGVFSPKHGIKKTEGMAYRGISFEEMEEIKRTGKIKSKGEYNIGEGQKGLTFFAKRPDSAAFYATSFTPNAKVPTPDTPAYVIGVPRKSLKEVKNDFVPDGEIGAANTIDASQIAEIHRADPYAIESGNQVWSKDPYFGPRERDGWGTNYSSKPGVRYTWTKED